MTALILRALLRFGGAHCSSLAITFLPLVVDSPPF